MKKLLLTFVISFVVLSTYAQQDFITRWDLTYPGSNPTQITFGVGTSGIVNYTWQEISPGTASGSGSFSGSIATISGLPAGSIILLSIEPTNFSSFNLKGLSVDAYRLMDVEQWGMVAWSSMEGAFYRSINLNITAIDLPNLAGVSNMSEMFYECFSLNGPANIGSWNTAAVTNMSGMFVRASNFNKPIGTWNTSSVTNMRAMFTLAENFNQPLANWNTSSVTNMALMFYRAYAFNQPIGAWNTGNVSDMSWMFREAYSFSQNLNTWNTQSVANMSFMFADATLFNDPIGNWNTSAVTDMGFMFENAGSFNQPIGNWNTSAVTDMQYMFSGASLFNQDLTLWNTSSVVYMPAMFANASSFDQSISNWNTSSVLSMDFMFYGATSFNQNIGNWTLNPSVNMLFMLENCGMDCANYGATLNGWANSPSCPSDRSLGAIGRQYGPEALTARNYLTTTKGWTISGDAAVAGANWYLDADYDGWYVSMQSACASPGAGWTSTLPAGGSGDCDDNNNSIFPGAAEKCGNNVDDNCDGQIDEGCCTITVNAGSDESTFFGYSGDQTITRTAVVTGGTAPYIYTWSLSRPLKCNQINTSGDEIFTLGSCSNTTCPSSGSLTLNPVCLGSASTKVKLMDTADVCVTVIDANGCVATDCFKVMAEDARCFAGNSNITKVKVCHLTGSPTNPYVQICVPEEAVANLIAQGDYVGSCISAREFDIEYKVNVFPNPNNGRFNIQIDSPQESDIIISAFDLSGKVVFETIVKNGSGINMHQVDLESVESGVYLLMLKDKGSNLITKKLITIN